MFGRSEWSSFVGCEMPTLCTSQRGLFGRLGWFGGSGCSGGRHVPHLTNSSKNEASLGGWGGLEVRGVREVGMVQSCEVQNADFSHRTNSSKSEASLGGWGGLEVGVFRRQLPTFRTSQIH